MRPLGLAAALNRKEDGLSSPCSLSVRNQTPMKKLFHFLLNRTAIFLFAGLLGTSSASATVISSTATGGAWNDTATWSPAQVPIAGDDVTITSGATVTVTTGAACATVAFGSGVSATLSINPGITLSVSGTLTIRRPSGNNTVAVGDGFLNAGYIAWPNGGTGQRHFLTINNGTVTVAGDVYTVASTTTSAVITFTGTGLLKVGGLFFPPVGTIVGTGATANGGGTFNQGTGTVEYNGAAQTVQAFAYSNLTLSGSGAKTMDNGTSVSGKLTIAPTGSARARDGSGAKRRSHLCRHAPVSPPRKQPSFVNT